MNLDTRGLLNEAKQESVRLFAELSKEGVQMCEAEIWAPPMLHTRRDGTGWIEGDVPKSEIGGSKSTGIGGLYETVAFRNYGSICLIDES